MEAKTKNMMLIGIGLAGAGLAGYFSWNYFSRKKQEDGQQDSPPAPAPPAGPAKPKAPSKAAAPKATVHKKPAPAKAPAQPADTFPLKRGSRGSNVRTFQSALIAKYGKSILPAHGADGSFGEELVKALKKLGLPAQVSETTFNVLTEAAAPDPSKLATEIFKGVQSRNHTKVLTELKKLKSQSDYTAVSNVFKNFRVDGGVRKSLVTGVLDNFADTAQKQQLKLEFDRMGLVYKEDKKTGKKKWLLAGVDAPTLVTTQPTWVWKSKTEYVKVPKSMVLGKFISKQRKFITFENAGKHFLVRAADVTRL